MAEKKVNELEGLNKSAAGDALSCGGKFGDGL